MVYPCSIRAADKCQSSSILDGNMEINSFDDNSDREIVKRVLAGSSEDFQLIISKYKDLIFSLVFRSISNPEDAEDLVQDIFYRLFLNLKKYNSQKKFYTWLT